MISDSEQTIGSTMLIDKMQNGRFRLFKKCSRLLNRGRDKMAHELKNKGTSGSRRGLTIESACLRAVSPGRYDHSGVPYTDEDLTIEVTLCPKGMSYELLVMI